MTENEANQYLDQWMVLWRQTDTAYVTLLKRWNLSLNSFFVLELLYRNSEGMEPAVIADSVNIMRQLVTIILNDFETKGLICRKELKIDHRRKRISLSAHGRRFAAEVVDAVNAIERGGIAEMSENELKLLVELSGRYCRHIQKYADGSQNMQ